MDFTNNRQKLNIVPATIEFAEKYLLDIDNIEQSWTGRLDAMFSNEFFLEAVQLIVNSITLFELGYFDSSFYSLRQSLEISTTVVYFVDDDESNRKEGLNKWMNQERFPMNNQMITELQKRQGDFANIRENMASYFQELEIVKQRLNKYVHKQGYDKFYVSRVSHVDRNIDKGKIITDFNEFITKCIGAIAVFRLAIDPFPLLLCDEAIYNRTGQLLTDGFHFDFIKKYVGLEHIENYKKTQLYKGYYESIIKNEEMLPTVVDLIKHDFINRDNFDEIFLQIHLLNQNQIIAVSLSFYSEKIVKIYYCGGFDWFFTSVKSKRKRGGYSSEDFKVFEDKQNEFNTSYYEVFLSCISLKDEKYYLEHNVEFTDSEISFIEQLSTTHNNL